MGISCIRPRLRVVLEILYTVHSTVQMIKLSGSGKQPTSHKMDQAKRKSSTTMMTIFFAVALTSGLGVNAAASSFNFVARHYFPAGYSNGTSEGVPEQ